MCANLEWFRTISTAATPEQPSPNVLAGGTHAAKRTASELAQRLEVLLDEPARALGRVRVVLLGRAGVVAVLVDLHDPVLLRPPRLARPEADGRDDGPLEG